jgi:hypothetical protein
MGGAIFDQPKFLVMRLKELRIGSLTLGKESLLKSIQEEGQTRTYMEGAN